MDQDTAERIDRELAHMACEDPERAMCARAAIDWLTAGEGLDLLDQRTLQDFLWYRLPTRWLSGVGHHHAVAEALGDLLYRLGLDRYTSICHAPATYEVLELWHLDETRGRRAFHKAMDTSGVEPPDTTTFSWSAMMGLREAAANTFASRRLEQAAVAGDLIPGGRAWRQRQAALVDAALDAPSDAGEASWRDEVVTERIERWLSARSAERHLVLTRVRDRIEHASPAPAEVSGVAGPVVYLLEHAREGVPLTATHRITPAFVTEMAQHFDWWRPSGRCLEEDVNEVWRTRQLAEELGVVRRRKDRLVATRNGRRLLDDPEELWRAVAGTLVSGDGFADVCGQLALAILLDAGELARSELVAQVLDVVAAEGWHDAKTGEPVTVRWVTAHGLTALPLLELLGVVETSGEWQHPHIQLTDVGVPTAAEALHRAASGPRRMAR